LENNVLKSEITYLKGVGPKRAEIFNKELGIYCFEDLLYHFPFRYIDKSQYHKIIEVNSTDNYYQIKGRIVSKNVHGKGRHRRMNAILEDNTGRIQLQWFQSVNWIEDSIEPGMYVIIFGKASLYKQSFIFTHPELTTREEDIQNGLFPVYHSTEKANKSGLHSKGISKLVKTLLEQYGNSIEDNLSQEIVQKYGLLNRQQAIYFIHFPTDEAKRMQAEARLKFEELFFIQLSVLQIKKHRHLKSKGHSFTQVGHFFNTFYKDHLPFSLTNAQKKVIKEIRYDMGQKWQMNRLLQGDVGSGKTMVALMAMLIAVDNNYQAALMAPTEILARQHFNTLKNYLKQMDVEVMLLTGSTPQSERKVLHEKLRNGQLKILVGTHALIVKDVVFHNLGFVVIDEQHRFGVAQRARLWAKNKIPPDVLVMTATPIPRTMAMTLYGDLDVSVIDELPKGRKPIQTFHFEEAKRLRVFEFMKKIIAQGQQVYVVYPLIEESESLDLKNIMEGYEALSRSFPLPQYRLSIVHGRMDAETKDIEMQRFAKGQTQILVSTTVIEVGVDVPNASLMVIENANRFGLSQLHQLRGRVGRGAEQSYCILMSEGKLSQEAKVRLSTMVESNDGFKIAQTDLQLRGPGDMAGTRQSGLLEFKLADLTQDEKILHAARKNGSGIIG
jgi:ATP-dependent DNA helicase RecG